ncbi:MAG: hypothetical protein AAFX81_08940 [Pseudomonadota bacterium]
MHAAVAVWVIITVVLVVAEPLCLRRWLHRRVARDPQGTLRLVRRLHRVLVTAGLITAAAAVRGAQGGL